LTSTRSRRPRSRRADGMAQQARDPTIQATALVPDQPRRKSGPWKGDDPSCSTTVRLCRQGCHRAGRVSHPPGPHHMDCLSSGPCHAAMGALIGQAAGGVRSRSRSVLTSVNMREAPGVSQLCARAGPWRWLHACKYFTALDPQFEESRACLRPQRIASGKEDLV